MVDALDRFLLEAASRKFKWGLFDCCLWLADWLMFALGIADPASHLRGRYESALSARALLPEGSIIRMVSEICSRLPIQQTKTPARGAIGVVLIKRQREVAGAIFDGHFWWLLTALESGVTGIQRAAPETIKVIRAWSIRCL